jgi:homospermidine synthase
MPPITKQEFSGQIVLIGYGSIGKGLLPLLAQHLSFLPPQLTIIDPHIASKEALLALGYQTAEVALTPENFGHVLTEALQTSTTQNLIINLATEVSSVDLIRFAVTHSALYIDTVVEPWPGFYQNDTIKPAAQTNYQLRENLLGLTRELKGNAPTAVSCCGANPGMVSWLVKEALITLARDTNVTVSETPTTQAAWANLMQQLGVKGIHIAERDTQRSLRAYEATTFTNTWSVDGLIAEALQPAELGWGTHEAEIPQDAMSHETGCKAGIFLHTPGVATSVETWVPSFGAIRGFLVTHNEAISIADYFSITNEQGDVVYRPTCHYAYHPSDATVSALEKLAKYGAQYFTNHHVLEQGEIESGADELGVLLYGHTKNAYWYGTKLSIEQARDLAPAQNATGLQVSSAVLAGIVWMLHNPQEGIVEAENMDHQFCLAIQKPYLGEVFGSYTTWHPEAKNHPDPWQFSNIRCNMAA